MSTHANIIIKERGSKLYFYRHSDGYPEGVKPTLMKFLEWLKEGKIRNNIGQASGWLIMLGAIEYNTIPKFKVPEPSFEGGILYGDIESIENSDENDFMAWKVGAYEPTTAIHGDIVYLYTIDLEKKQIEVKQVYEDEVVAIWR